MKDPIVQVGDDALRQKAKPLARKDIGSRETRALIARMKKALAGEEHGVAIAAPQVGASLRLFVVAGRVFQPQGEDGGSAQKQEDRVFINPEITRRSRKKAEMAEGCLSVRGKYGAVMRHEKATLRALDERGEEATYHASGFLAQIFQHETDHLDGILYIDKAVRLVDDPSMK